jgi:hypothetical protein
MSLFFKVAHLPPIQPTLIPLLAIMFVSNYKISISTVVQIKEKGGINACFSLQRLGRTATH